MSGKLSSSNDAAFNVKPVSKFSLLGEPTDVHKGPDLQQLLQDDDIRKLERLQLINASARYELLSANQ